MAFIKKQQKKNKTEKRLYFLLYQVLKNAIINSEIPSSTALPPSRRLAILLKLSRSTVLKAFDLLILEGYIESRLGSGYYVKQLENDSLANKIENEQVNYPSLSYLGKSFLKNIGLINSTEDKSVAFRPGIPPLDIFPVNQWKNLSNLYWRHIKSSALTYSPSSGNEQLKKNIANYLNLSRGLKCDSKQVIIVSGSLQSLYLAGSVILDPDDSILMENPTFPNVISIFKSLRANIYGSPVDKEGMAINNLKAKGLKLIHCTPSGHYPSGIPMSLKRRKALLSLVTKHNSYIIENDYEHELNNYYQSIPSIFSLDEQDRTIYMGTFNRLLHPSIRIGYMVLPFHLIKPVEALMNHSHRFVPPSIQVVLNQFIEKKYLYNHIKNVHSVANRRKKIFIKDFEKQFGSEIQLSNKSANSLHLLAEFDQDIDDEGLIKEFAKKNILAHTFSKCFIGKNKSAGLILGYPSVKVPFIKKKIVQMAEVYNEQFLK